MPSFRIRAATPSDLTGIVTIYNQAVAAQQTADVVPVTVSAWRPWFDRHDADRFPVLVAERDGDVIGWSSLSEYRGGRGAVRHTAEISYYVHLDHRRQGVASSLIAESMARCPALGIKTLFAILLEDNLPSIRLLEKSGFERWGRLPDVADFDGREVGHLYYGRRVRSSTDDDLTPS